MSGNFKNQDNILSKLRITELNPMQIEAHEAIQTGADIILLSPTGTGKTLAFLLPIIEEIDPQQSEIQVLIVVPTRELAIQIEQVIREMGTGYKANAVYGGRAGSQDKIDLKHRPAILIGTPGRLADHIRKESFSTDFINTIVLDEFDKSLEIGFETEMKEIMLALNKLKKRILTSATQKIKAPEFVGLKSPHTINYLKQSSSKLKQKIAVSPVEDKRETLIELISNIGNEPGIIFCNFKDTIELVSEFLTNCNISHACFHGGMEQMHRERALIKFRNGSHQLLIATDLAARGIDVPEIKNIIHFELPLRLNEYVHRNGRTARMNSTGTAYILKSAKQEIPDFIHCEDFVSLKEADVPSPSKWTTLYINGGRRDKISKGDIAGLFLKQGDLSKDQLGVIELKQDSAFVGILKSEADKTIQKLNNSKLKTKKIRISHI